MGNQVFLRGDKVMREQWRFDSWVDPDYWPQRIRRQKRPARRDTAYLELMQESLDAGENWEDNCLFFQ